jgi:DNA-directed RNA polymerase subunit RPC12/RpoP
MSRHHDRDDHWDEDGNDEDWDSSFADDDDEDDSTIQCPYCDAEIHDDSVRCPHCENYLSRVDSPRALQPAWIVIGVILCLFLVLSWVFFV